METFDEDRLRQSLARLDPWKRMAFMTLCCERMVPNYDRFTADSGFGDSLVLRRGIDAAWSWLESNRVPDDFESVRARVEQQAPDTAGFSSPFTSAALDAANAVASVLDAISEPEGADAIEVASLARDTVDLYVQEIENLDPNDRGLEEAIRRHPLMQAELRRQREDLAHLERWTGSRGDAVRELHARGGGVAVGSLAVVAN
jgi:uncharacterized protein YjaG (DUF416 family)